VGSCERGNEHLGPTKDVQLLPQIRVLFAPQEGLRSTEFVAYIKSNCEMKLIQHFITECDSLYNH
jgi:hypothetical protein